jgi:hypothetical protein
MSGSSQGNLSQITKLPPAIADSDAQVGLGFPLSFTKPSFSGHFLYTGRCGQYLFNNMRHNIISPKYIYYMGLLVHLCALSFFTFIFAKAVESGDTLALILLLSFGTIWFLYFIFFFLNKFIYISSDNKDKVIHFGNIFFRQESTPDQIRVIKKVFWFRQTFKIQIGEKFYYFISLQPTLESVEKSLRMDL